MKKAALFRTLAATFALAVLAPFAARAQMAPPNDAVAGHRAEVQRLTDEQAGLQKKLDEAYAEIQDARHEKNMAFVAVVVTLLLCGGAMGVFFFQYNRKTGKARRELADMNAKLDRQWKDLRSANEELTKVNKELADTITAIKKNRA